MDAAGFRGLNDVTFYAGIPALMVLALADAGEPRVLDIAGAYFAAALAVFALAVALARQVLGAGLSAAGAIGLNAAYGNLVMLGIPIVSAAFGPPGLAVLISIIALHSVVMLPLASVLIEADRRGTADPLGVLLRTLPGLARNPILAAILLALAWHGLGLPIPAPLRRLLELASAAASPLALVCLGGTLPGFAGRGALREAGLATALKLVLLPALVWGLAALLGLGPMPTAVAVLAAGLPTGANAFLFARRAGEGEAAAAGAGEAAAAGTVVVSTALSVLTLPALLAWLR